jgi:hypothetical protein
VCLLEPDDFTIYLEKGFQAKVGSAVRGHLRGSDFATVEDTGRLLMLFTEITERMAEAAVRRLVTTLNSLVFEEKPHRWRAALAHYPRDGTKADDPLEAAHRLLIRRPAA